MIAGRKILVHKSPFWEVMVPRPQKKLSDTISRFGKKKKCTKHNTFLQNLQQKPSFCVISFYRDRNFESQIQSNKDVTFIVL